MRSVAEVVYIPIYVEGAPEAGVQAVMEIMVSSSAWEAMVVANLISFVSSTLNDLKVGLHTFCKPAPCHASSCSCLCSPWPDHQVVCCMRSLYPRHCTGRADQLPWPKPPMLTPTCMPCSCLCSSPSGGRAWPPQAAPQPP